MLITVATFREPWEAHMFRGRLHAEGVFAVVAHDRHVGVNWVWSTALGGAKVQVLRSDAEKAREIESQCRAGDFKSALAQQFGDLDDPYCPACGSVEWTKRRPFFQAAIAITTTALFVMLPPWNWIYVCKKCGTEFKTRYGLIGQSQFGGQIAMTFDEAAIADIPDILRIRLAVTENVLADPSRMTPADIATMIQKDGKGWVCRIDGVIRGFSFADTTRQNIWVLFVEPDFERMGIGRWLHNTAVDWLFENGAQSIWLTTAPGTKAEKFYRAAGWRLADVEENDDYRFELDPEIWEKRRRKF